MKRREFTIEQGKIKEKFSVSDKLSYEDYEPKYQLEVWDPYFGWTRINYCNTIKEGHCKAKAWLRHRIALGDYT